MVRRIFTVAALWDAEAKIFYSESDIDGLHIEAETIKEFENLMMELGPDLILANHILRPENANLPLSDMIPAIQLQLPQNQNHA